MGKSTIKKLKNDSGQNPIGLQNLIVKLFWTVCLQF